LTIEPVQSANPHKDLEESRARLALAVSATSLGIWDWDLTTNRMDYSDRAKEIFGFPLQGEVTFEMARDATHPEDLARTFALARQALDPEIKLKAPYEYRIVRPDGEVRWVIAHGECVFGAVDGETRALRYVGTIQDVTEAKKVEQALRTSEERLRLVLGAARLAVWEVDMQSDRLIDPSPELKRMLGFAETDDLDLHTVRTHYAPGERDRIRAETLEQVERGEDFIHASFRYIWPDGSERQLLLRAQVHRNEHGQPGRIVGVLLDITEQKTAEAALRESEQRRRRAQEAGGIGDWTIELTTDDLTFSEQFVRLLDRTPEDMPKASSSLIPFVHPQDWPRLSRHLAALRSGRIAKLDVEHRVLLPKGSVRWLASRAEARRGEDGQVTHIAGVSFDITPRREAEEAMRRINETLEAEVAKRTRELEAANRKLLDEAQERQRMEQVLHQVQKMEAIGQLTGGVAHDFNNLLMAVMGNLDLLRKHLPRDPRTDRYLDGAIRGAKRGAALTQRLLAFARRQELRASPVDLVAVIASMEDLLEKSTGPVIETKIELPQSLPLALADPNQVELALLNLVVNARDAMPEGGLLTVGLSHENIAAADDLAAGEYVCLAVTDTGIGMPEEVLQRAMEPFFSTKEVGRGTGLGLSMVHGLAEQLGGAVRLFSEAGKGTRAELWFPVAPVASDATTAPATGSVVPEVEPATILFVDDDALVAMGTVDMLEDLGHRVIEANSGDQALEILRQKNRIDLLITDHSMPGMTGTQLAKAAQTLRPGLPVLLATGYAELPDETEPGLPRLAKPFVQEQIAAEIGKLLAK
jgi:PAS domain S-box-containing protein